MGKGDKYKKTKEMKYIQIINEVMDVENVVDFNIKMIPQSLSDHKILVWNKHPFRKFKVGNDIVEITMERNGISSQYITKINNKYESSIKGFENFRKDLIKRIQSLEQIKQPVDAIVLLNSIGYGWQKLGKNSAQFETNDRTDRIDHGGGEDGEDWMDDDEQYERDTPYKKKWASTIDAAEKILHDNGFKKATGYVDVGEKGHVTLVINNIN